MRPTAVTSEAPNRPWWTQRTDEVSITPSWAPTPVAIATTSAAVAAANIRAVPGCARNPEGIPRWQHHAVATFHCELAWLGDDRAAADVLVTVEGDRISAVEAGATAPPDSTRLAGLTLPGFANAHSHAFHRALRGRTQAGSGSFWTWREQMYALAARLDPDSYQALARATFAEMALAGVSCVGEFHYLHHQAGGVTYADPNAMGAAVAAAAAEAGLRITLLDTCYLQGGFDVAADETQRRFSDGDVAGVGHARLGARRPAGPAHRRRRALRASRRPGGHRRGGGVGRRARRSAARPRVGTAGRARPVPSPSSVAPRCRCSPIGTR